MENARIQFYGDAKAMRNSDAETNAALINAPDVGISVRNYIWLSLVDGSNFGFSSDIEPAEDIEVLDGATGNPVLHTYYGAGSIQRVGTITLTTGLTVRRVTFDLSEIHETVKLMTKGHSVRNAHVEIHRGVVSTATGQLVNRPRLHFLGTVNTIAPTRPAVGGAGAVTFDCTSFVNELTRTNPAKSSDSHQRSRINDRIYQYADIMGEIKVQWGGKQ